MLRIRLVEETIANLYPEQEIRCPVHLCTGQEAVPVEISAHLGPDDYVFSNHRSHGHYLARGGSMKKLFAEIYGRETGCAKGRGGSQHLVDRDLNFFASPILGSMIPVAVGTAFQGHFTVCYFGDGATEEGVFYESLNFAALHRLPILFVCEDNGWSVNTPYNKRRNINIPTLVKSFGIDVNTEIKRTGPQFLYFRVNRWMEHCGPNKGPDYGKDDPITDRTGEDEILEEIKEAVEFARNSPYPTDLTEYVYPDV